MPSCTFPRNLHRNAKHYVGLPRFILKTKHQSSFILPKILLKIDSECDTMSKTTKNLRESSRTPPRRLQDGSKTRSSRPQDASKPPPSRIKIVRQSTRGFKPPPSSVKDCSRRLQNSKTSFQAASKTPPRRPKKSPKCFHNGMSYDKITFSSLPQPTATSAVYAQAVLLCNLLPISNNSEIIHTRGSAALA